MPLYEVYKMSNDRNMGVYEYSDEDSLKKFIRMFPNWQNLLYNEITEKKAEEIRKMIKEQIMGRVDRLKFELWGKQLMED